MTKAAVVYYSATGNTQMVADSIYEVLENVGIESSISFVSDVTVSDVADCDILFLGSPAMGIEEIEDYEFRPFFDDLKQYLSGKSIVIFGSYDWGDQDWLNNWAEEVVQAGGILEARFAVNLTPDDQYLDSVKDDVTEILKKFS